MREFRYCPRCTHELSLQTFPDAERMACTNCGYIHYDNPTPVLAAIVEYGDEIVLAHNKSWPPQWYGLITGFLEKQEKPEEGVLREVKEELDLDGEVVEMIGTYSFFRMNQIILAYHVKAEGTITLNEELDAYRLVTLDKLRPWKSGTGKAVKDFLAKRGIFNEEISF